MKEKSRMLIEIFEHHNKQFEELVDKDFSLNTCKKYKTGLKSLKEFLTWKFSKKDSLPQKVTPNPILPYGDSNNLKKMWLFKV